MTHVLLVEDDESLGFVVKDNLEQEGYRVDWQKTGPAARECFGREAFDVCLLDVMLPGLDGFSLAEAIRRTDAQVPILFLTARSLQEDRLKGFRLGGDDYLTKPFSIEELVLRMEAILRRARPRASEVPRAGVLPLGRYRFDPAQHRLESPAGTTTDLTPREAALLALLHRHANQVVPRERILRDIWGKDDYFLGRSLDVFISRLRKYLHDDEALRIVNVHGVGFRLEGA
jgi:DNA-binding response OmpR family regulator